MTYKDAVTAAMDSHAAHTRSCFVGYGLKSGRAMGTLRNVPEAKLREMPTAENLMTGAAIGMALVGQLPLVYFERADFLLNAADAIINHLAQISSISRGQFAPGVIIRVTVGNRTKPLFTGRTHTQDFTAGFQAMLPEDSPVTVKRCVTAADVQESYYEASVQQLMGFSYLIFEYKDLM